jgi:hypothetical protein
MALTGRTGWSDRRFAGLDEEAAFLRLQQMARESSQKMVDVARTIIKAEAAFQPPGHH